MSDWRETRYGKAVESRGLFWAVLRTVRSPGLYGWVSEERVVENENECVGWQQEYRTFLSCPVENYFTT